MMAGVWAPNTERAKAIAKQLRAQHLNKHGAVI
jgi:hypothetical protein